MNKQPFKFKTAGCKLKNSRSWMRVFLLFGLFALLFLEIPANAGTIETISPERSAALIQQNKGNAGFVILDIRTPAEFQLGHLENAALMDYYADTFPDQLKELDKNKTYLVYCRSGNRSGKALSLFSRLGFQSVYNMADGINGWVKAGYPLVR